MVDLIHTCIRLRRAPSAIAPLPAIARLVTAALLLLATATTVAQAQTNPPTPGIVTHYDRWMAQLFAEKPAALDQPLARFIFAGSHDAAAYDLTGQEACAGCFVGPVADLTAYCSAVEVKSAFLGGVCRTFVAGTGILLTKIWGDAQHLTIREQLDTGARYLDLRFFRATAVEENRSGGRLQAGRFYAYHALAGPDSAVVLQDIAGFVSASGHEQEVLILELGGLKEGNGDMSPGSIDDFLTEVRSYLGPYMAPKRNGLCASDPACAPTARYGAQSTVGEVIASGRRVIVTCTCAGTAADIWDPIASQSPYSLGDYPHQDDPSHPWISDRDWHNLLMDLSEERDRLGQTDFFALGIQTGVSEDGHLIVQSAVCPVDPGNVSGMCGATNEDWDHFMGLREVAAYTNPMALGALVALPRHRINIVVGDHYSTEFTDEVFKLNRGATRVEVVIDTVTESGNHDTASDPDYYPVFLYPGATPFLWSVRSEENVHIPNEKQISPSWPGWKSYPNDFGTASVRFGINDSDSAGAGADDPSAINFFPGEPTTLKPTSVPITGCVQDAASCLDVNLQRFTWGYGDPSSVVTYRVGSCVWSWLPGEEPDPASLCDPGEIPTVVVYGPRLPEGNSGTTPFPFEFRLTAPGLATGQLTYYTLGGSASSAGVIRDYTGRSSTPLTFAPGQTRQTVTVDVNGDTSVEGDETIQLNLTQPSGLTLGSSAATATILNDDLPVLSVAGVTRSEGNAGTTSVDFTVTLSPAAAGSVTVRYATSDGTATAGSDFTALADTRIHFSPGDTVKTVSVLVNGDTAVEADETFLLNLYDATDATLSTTSAIGTILNDDTAATLITPGPHAGSEGVPASVALGTLVDSRPAGPWTVTAEWGDGTSDVFAVNQAGTLARTHLYKDSGPYVVTVSAIDADGVPATGVLTFKATIANISPTATLSGSPGVEGTPVVALFTAAVDPSPADIAAGLRFAYSCTNGPLTGITWAASSVSPSVSCTFPDNGTYTVRGRVIDRDNGFTEYTSTLTVANVPPTAGAIVLRDANGNPVQGGIAAGQRIDLDASFTDPGTLDTHQATIEWGDGTVDPGQVSGSGGSGRVGGWHAWFAPGRYTVRVTVADDDAGTSARELTLDVASVGTALCQSLQPLQALAQDPTLSAEVRRGVTGIVLLLRGNRDGGPADGACDQLDRGNWVAAVVRLSQAVDAVERLLRGSVAQGSIAFGTLRTSELQMIQAAKDVYLLLAAAKTTKTATVVRAAALAQRADAAVAAGKYGVAMEMLLAAVRLLTAAP